MKQASAQKNHVINEIYLNIFVIWLVNPFINLNVNILHIGWFGDWFIVCKSIGLFDVKVCFFSSYMVLK